MGDSGPAVNPNDDRYQHLIGKTAIVPFINRSVPIIADEYVTMDFGTGCLKVLQHMILTIMKSAYVVALK